MNENKVKIIELRLIKSDVYLLVCILVVQWKLLGEDLGSEEEL